MQVLVEYLCIIHCEVRPVGKFDITRFDLQFIYFVVSTSTFLVEDGKLFQTLIFGRFLNFLKIWFLLSNLKSECVNSQIKCTKIFIKFLLQDKKWERLQNRQKYILQQKNVVAGKNLPYMVSFPYLFIPLHGYIDIWIVE